MSSCPPVIFSCAPVISFCAPVISPCAPVISPCAPGISPCAPQDLVEDILPVISLQLYGRLLDRLASLFEAYAGMLHKALPVPAAGGRARHAAGV